eukprot:5077291-Karenia_brevis.AAC.1
MATGSRYMCEIITIRLVRGHEALIDKFRQLKARPTVAKHKVSIYIDNHPSDLVQKHEAVKLLSARQGASRQQFMEHINIRA